VRAARPCGVEECGDVLGPAATVAAQLPPAATSQPGPGQSGPGSTVGPAPGATGGTGTAQRPSSLGGFTAFGPKLGQPKLPPMPDNVPPAVAAPLPDTFDPTLDYGQQPEVADGELVPEAAAGRDGTRLSSTGGMLGDEQVMRGVAGALVLMMSGAHLRAWLGKLREDPLGL
jgi:hypothetical protein